MFDLAKLTNDTEICILDFSDDNHGVISYKILAPSDATIERSNAPLTATKTVGDYKIYDIQIPLTQDSNSLTLDIEKNGVSYVYSQVLGGKATVYSSADWTSSNFFKQTVSPVFSLVDGSAVSSELSGNIAKVELASVENDSVQAFCMKGEMLDSITENASKYIMRVYYDGTDEPEFVISAKHKKAMMYYDLTTVKLKQGMNEIVISLTGKNWKSLGEIEYLAFYVGGKAGEPQRSMYFVDCVLYNK